MTTQRFICMNLLTILLLAACAPVTSGDLVGTQWELVSLDGNDQVGQKMAGHVITIQFEGTEVGGSSGCNSYGGTYTATAGGSISFSALVSTLMACEAEGVMEVEQSFFEALNAADRYEITLCEACADPEILTISGGGHILVFARM